MVRRIAIVGAGASGLPSIRHALAYGFEPVCFEATDGIGGLWNYKTDVTDDATVMKSTVINSSKEMTAYSDFPPKPDEANFMHNKRMLKYYHDYADHFGLKKYIKHNHYVINVERCEDFITTGRWNVEYRDDRDMVHNEAFDGVLLATGHYKEPMYPKPWPGMETFRGKIIHAHDYKDSKGFEDKRGIVVGIGNSGADIAVELSRSSEQVFLSTRRGAWIFPRTQKYGVPADIVENTRFQHFVTNRVTPDRLRDHLLRRKLWNKFDHDIYGLRPDYPVLGCQLTVNDELCNRIASGTVRVKPNIQSIAEDSVTFTDGTVEQADYIILATGYNMAFPMAEKGTLIPVQGNQVDMYLFMYPLELQHNSLAVIGLFQSTGAVMPVSEMQARLYFSAMAGEATLPLPDVMRNDVVKRREDIRRRLYNSPRNTVQVNYISYMDELGTFIGCRPQGLSLFLSDPKLALAVTMGPCAPYLYRLRGPHKWEVYLSTTIVGSKHNGIVPGARDAILGISKRVHQGINPSACMRETPCYALYLLVILVGLWFSYSFIS